jgi:Lrp/AsnC family transcriptional regulator, leucine-responsive regulatory protein
MLSDDDGSFQFGPTDLSIIAKLKANGRATNREIAEELGLAPNTVSSRIRQLEAAGLLRVIAVSDFSAHRHNVLIQLAIEVDNRNVWEAANELAAFPEVLAAHVINGNYDIDLLVAVEDFDALKRFMLESLATIKGIRSMEPSIAVDIRKYIFDHILT